MIGIMIMNPDDYRYFFSEVRSQPRAIIPASGSPVFVGFAGEEADLRRELGDESFKVFSHVGEQISNVRETFRELYGGPPPGIKLPASGRPRVGMQLWFHTPAFLVDLFRKVNPQVELVSSDPVMDELRMVKEPDEIELMKRAQAIAAIGMDRVRELLKPGAQHLQVEPPLGGTKVFNRFERFTSARTLARASALMYGAAIMRC